MGRTKLYDRDTLLETAMLVFWERGYADTSLQQLERATGVNKSGLYAEFAGKDDLYLASLRHYLAQRAGEGLLTRLPLGWRNVEALLRKGPACGPDRKGCFAVNAMREFASLPSDAVDIVSASQADMLALLSANIAAEGTRMPARAVAEIVQVFFIGLCVDMQADLPPRARQRKIRNFLDMIKAM